MAFSPGARLGSYEISAKLGEGGMGEVYRATDSKLKREVAIKVLPAAVSGDAERLARLQREAEVLASLNHPNIAAIYGLEESADTKALVMELVEGDTLAQRLAHAGSGLKTQGSGGPRPEGSGLKAQGSGLPVEEALGIAKQIAEALEAAHEQGIIHRDLKPANVKLRPDGAVKVLDFGLAKALDAVGSRQSAAGSESMAPTITTPAMTQAGLILGTAAYMSPEQARGRPVDRRTDIWAFGCVLYEMLTGRRAFEDEDVSLTLSKVLQRDPDYDVLPPAVPTRVRNVVQLCLRKPLKERVPDIGAVRLALDGAFETTVTVEPTQAEATGARWWSQPRWTTALAVLGVLVGLGTGWGLWVAGRTETIPPVRRFSFVLPDAQTLPLGGGRRVAVSPDGQTLVYRAGDEAGVFRLYRRQLDQLGATAIPGTEGANQVQFFSPDGQWLAFYAGSTLMRTAMAGGTPTRIAEIPGPPRGGSWGDGFVIVGLRGQGLGRIVDTGGEVEQLTTPDNGRQHWYPQLLPGGRAVLFTDAEATAGDLKVFDLETEETRTVVSDGVAGHYTLSGHLVFLRGGDLWAVTFDLDTLTAGDRPALVEQGIRVEGGGAVQFAVAGDGSLVYIPGGVAALGQSVLVWVDDEGQEQALPVRGEDHRRPRVSPDGSQVAIEIRGEGTSSVWVADAVRGTLSRITPDATDEQTPVWTPDGEHLVYSSVRDGTWGFYRKSADGTGEEELLGTVENASVLIAGNWSPDGKRLVFGMGWAGGVDIGVLSVDDGTWAPLLNSAASEFGPAISPDGQWIAYSSNDTGVTEVYLQRFPGLGGRRQVSSGGALDAAWSPDGRTLYYLRNTDADPLMDEMVSVSVNSEPQLVIGRPEIVLQHEYRRPFTLARYYDLAPDGRRFVFVTSPGRGSDAEEEPPAAAITVVQSWFTELARLVPVE